MGLRFVDARKMGERKEERMGYGGEVLYARMMTR